VEDQDAYRPGAVRYDSAERSNFVRAPIAQASLELLLEWEPRRIQDYCRSLMHDFLEEAARLGFVVEDEAWRSSHLFGLRMPESVDLAKLRDDLGERNVSVSLRGNALRVSPNVYNDATDVDVLLDVLTEAVA
jgi:selenocysteine lyase/cysteine desulfurase